MTKPITIATLYRQVLKVYAWTHVHVISIQADIRLESQNIYKLIPYTVHVQLNFTVFSQTL